MAGKDTLRRARRQQRGRFSVADMRRAVLGFAALKRTPEKAPAQDATHRDGKTIIGWSEHVDFPEWGIEGLHAKIDTGARSSALHVEDLDALPDGQVRFTVVVSRKHDRSRVTVTAPVLKWGKVRSSTGHYTTRCFVRVRMRLGSIEKPIDLSLVSREKMLYRMIVGRKALAHDFVVDVSRRRALGKRRIRRLKGRK